MYTITLLLHFKLHQERNNRQSFWIVDEVCDGEIFIKKNSQHHHQWFPRSGPAYAAGVHDPTDLGVAETSAAIAGLCAPCMHTHKHMHETVPSGKCKKQHDLGGQQI